jgi:hypothetical protein
MNQARRELLKSKLFFHFSITVLGLSILTMSVIIYWLTAPYDPLVFKDTTPEGYIKVENRDSIRNNEFIKLNVHFEKTVEERGTIEAYIVGTVRSELALQNPREASHKGVVDYDAIFQLPEFNTLEPRYIEFVITYQVNPLRIVTETIRTETFPIKE